uniref:Uncharacterized protein n=2 Tax=Aegilops tauschii subsp. strangulata TaxID=200361 RepID=A0A453KPN6_AEGTS
PSIPPPPTTAIARSPRTRKNRIASPTTPRMNDKTTNAHPTSPTSNSSKSLVVYPVALRRGIAAAVLLSELEQQHTVDPRSCHLISSSPSLGESSTRRSASLTGGGAEAGRYDEGRHVGEPDHSRLAAVQGEEEEQLQSPWAGRPGGG